jgi:hypothetical protein
MVERRCDDEYPEWAGSLGRIAAVVQVCVGELAMAQPSDGPAGVPRDLQAVLFVSVIGWEALARVPSLGRSVHGV